MRIKLDIPLKLKSISSYMKATQWTDLNPTINFICTDTREIQAEDLFIALMGENNDGEAFIEEALKKGAFTVGKSKLNTHLQVTDTRIALLNFAKNYKYLLPLIKTVAITGSVGKTTTKELLYHLSLTKYKTHKTFDNLNNELGVSYTILSAPKNTEILIVEAGMNNMGELSRLSECIEPDIAIITKIGSSHIGNLGSREMITKSKLQITDYLKSGGKTLIPYEEILLKNVPNALTVSTKSRSADFYLLENNRTYEFISRTRDIRGVLPKILGFHIPYCLAFALAVGELLLLDETNLITAVENIPQSVSRGKLLIIGNLNIYDDSYNSSPESVEAALSTISNTNFTYKSALLGDINELGNKTEELHREIGRLCCKYEIENLFVYGVYSEFIAAGAIDAGFDKTKIFKNSDTANPIKTAMQINDICQEDEIILFKASHKLNLKEIISMLKNIKEKTN